MSYVDVVLDRPTDDPFTYRLTPETLLSANPGTLVEVPVGPKREYGVVVARRRRVGHELRDKLRPIERVLSPGTWAPARSIQLARALGAYTGESVGVCLFRILPPPAKRSLPQDVPSPTHPQSGRVLHCYGGHRQRLDQYQQLIAKTQVAGRQTVVIAPIARHQWLAQQLASSNRRIKIATAELSPTQQRQLASELASGAVDVLIGSRHVVGWPAHALGLLIIDEPTNQSHQDEQRPYADSATIATLRQTIDGGHCVLGLSGPVPAAALREQRELAQKITTSPAPGRLSFQSPTRLGALNPSVLSKIERILATGGHVALIAPRHGIGGQVSCRDCDQLLSCPDCGSQLEPLVDGRTLRCSNCDQTMAWPAACPHCQGLQLQSWGIGEESVKRALRRQHPQLLTNGLVVSTEGIFETPLEWQLVFFLAADSPLSAPDLLRPIRYTHAIAEALGTGAEVIVETRDSTQPLLSSLNPLTSLNPLLLERSRAHLPPYARTLTLRGPLKDQARLSALLRQQTISQHQQRNHEVSITLHIPPPEFAHTRQELRGKLGRSWTVITDSVLEHAEPLRDMMIR